MRELYPEYGEKVLYKGNVEATEQLLQALRWIMKLWDEERKMKRIRESLLWSFLEKHFTSDYEGVVECDENL